MGGANDLRRREDGSQCSHNGTMPSGMQVKLRFINQDDALRKILNRKPPEHGEDFKLA